MNIKTIIFLLALICTFSIKINLKSKNDDFVNSGCIKAYSECDFKGEFIYDYCGENNLNLINPGFNINSFKIGKNTQVTLYKEEFRGENITLEDDVNCLSDYDFSNQISSLNASIVGNKDEFVPMFCARLWTKCKFKGLFIDVCGEIDLSQDSDFNDKTKSIQIGKFTKLTVYSEEKMNGDFIELYENNDCLDDYWQKNISSVKVEKYVTNPFQ